MHLLPQCFLANTLTSTRFCRPNTLAHATSPTDVMDEVRFPSTIEQSADYFGTSGESYFDESLPPPLPPSPKHPSRTPSPPPPPNRSIYPRYTSSGWRVQISPYNPEWPQQYTEISAYLTKLLETADPPVNSFTIEHIGSTSVPGLCAKPNIDILITVPDSSELHKAMEALDWGVPEKEDFPRYKRIPNGGGIQGRESYKLFVPYWSQHYYTTPERSVYIIKTDESNKAGLMQICGYRSLRETLRNPENKDLLYEYAEAKMECVNVIFDSAITYSQKKNAVVRKILLRSGWTDEEISAKETLDVRREDEVDEDELP